MSTESEKQAALALKEERIAMLKASPATVKFELLQRRAKMFAESDLVPAQF